MGKDSIIIALYTGTSVTGTGLWAKRMRLCAFEIVDKEIGGGNFECVLKELNSAHTVDWYCEQLRTGIRLGSLRFDDRRGAKPPAPATKDWSITPERGN